jgi:hypothetical protein
MVPIDVPFRVTEMFSAVSLTGNMTLPLSVAAAQTNCMPAVKRLGESNRVEIVFCAWDFI